MGGVVRRRRCGSSYNNGNVKSSHRRIYLGFCGFNMGMRCQRTIIMTLTVDGSNTTANSVTTTITTTKPNDIILLFQAGESNDPATSVTDAAGLTWAKEGPTVSMSQSGQGGPSIEVGTLWWALSPGILTNNTITTNGNAADGRLMVMAINGANLTTPFDTNPSTPSTATTANGTTVSVTGFSTTAPNTMLVSWARAFQGPSFTISSGPSGFSSVISGGSFTGLYSQTVSVVQSSITETFTYGGNTTLIQIAVAIQAPSTTNPNFFLMFNQ